MEKKGYKGLKPSFKADFYKMCNELKYKPKKTNSNKKEGDINGFSKERTLYSGRGRGTL